MSAGEIIASLAANFIVAGVVWYLKGTNSGLVCLGIGFVLLIVAYFFRKKPQAQPPPPSPLERETTSTHQTGAHIDFKPSITVSPQFTQANQDRVSISSPVEEKREKKTRSPKPIIEQLKAKLVHARSDEYDIWRQGPADYGTRAVIVPFYYDPKSKVRSELYLRAHLVIRDKDSGHRTNVSAACWLDENLNHVVMRPGDEKSVLVLAFRGDGKPVTCWNTVQTSDPYTEETEGIKLRELSMSDKSIEITLLWDEDESSETYSFDLNNLEGLRTITQT